MNVTKDSMDSEALRKQQQQQHRLYNTSDTSDDDLIVEDFDSRNLLHPKNQTSSTPFQRNGRYAKYTLGSSVSSFGLGPVSSSRRSRLLYSPWTVFTITILFFLLLYIPLFTFRDSSGMCKFDCFV